MCLKCGLDNSKTTAAALVEFLDWAEMTFKIEDKTLLRESGDVELQETTYAMGADDFAEDMEEDEYESEDWVEEEEDEDDDIS